MKKTLIAERCKEGSRKAFMKIGNMAVGNASNGDGQRANAEPVVPFTFIPFWAYEKPMPKRKR